MSPGELVLLDRDGVINEDSDDYIRSVADWRPIPGSLEAVGRLSRAGASVAVVSNQSGLARGLFSEEALRGIHAAMREGLARAGGDLAGVFFCPHHPEDGCACRKPRPGLLRQVERELSVSVVGAPLVGDQRSDIELARGAGCMPVLVRTGKGAAVERGGDLEDVEVFDDLAAFVEAWLAR